MTEKRFTYENNRVKDNLTGEFHSSNKVSVNVLNELVDENRMLQDKLDVHILLTDDERLKVNNFIKELKKENERLKQQVEVLYDLNNDELASYEEKILNIINTRITYYQHKPFSAPITNPANPNYDADVDRLARLSELKELKKELHR